MAHVVPWGNWTNDSSTQWVDNGSTTTTTTWLLWANDTSTTSFSNLTLRVDDRVLRIYDDDPDRPAERERAARARSLAEASERARHLLFSILTEEQRAMYEACGSFIIRSQHGHLYEICHALQHNVFRLCAAGANRIFEHCAHVPGVLPIEDNLVAQKLMLECHEDAFLQMANTWDLRGGRNLYHRSGDPVLTPNAEAEAAIAAVTPTDEDGFLIDENGDFVRDENGNFIMNVDLPADIAEYIERNDLDPTQVLQDAMHDLTTIMRAFERLTSPMDAAVTVT